MKSLLRYLTIALLVTTTAIGFGQTIITPINNGKLTTDLNVNSFKLQRTGKIVFGTASVPVTENDIGTLHFTGTPTQPYESGLRWSDLQVYRSASSTLRVVGNLSVSGTLTASNLPTTNANNSWTGSNTFLGSVTLGGTTLVQDNGLTFSVNGLTATKAAMGLTSGVPGGVQAYDPDLAAIAALSPTAGAVIVGSGSAWVQQSGNTARTSLGLGTADSPTFAALTVSGAGSFGGALTASGGLLAPAAVSSGAGISIGATAAKLWAPNSTDLVTDRLFTANGGVKVGDNAADLLDVTGSIVWAGDAGTALHRVSSGLIRLDGALNVVGALTLNSALGVTSGGTGVTSVTTGQMLYATGSNAFGTTASTAYGRALLTATGDANFRSLTGLGTAATLSYPVSGNAASGEVVKGDDTRLTDGRVPSGAAGGSLAGNYPNPTLSLTGVAAATYGSAALIPVLQISTEGRVQSASTQALVPSVSSDLTGTWPDVLIKANAVALGTDTTGNYVGAVTGSNGIVVTNGSSEGGTANVALAQDLSTAGTPQFAGLTLTGGLTGTTATLSGLLNGASATFSGTLGVTGALTASGGVSTTSVTASGGISAASLTLTGNLTGVTSAAQVFVDEAAAGATDTRTGLSAYDKNRPFVTIGAAITAAAAGDTIVVMPRNSGSYSSPPTVTKGVHFDIRPGSVVDALTLNSSIRHTLSGGGILRNLILQGSASAYLDTPVEANSGVAVTVSGGSSTLYAHKPIRSITSTAIALSSAGSTAEVYAPVITYGAAQPAVTHGTATSTLKLYGGGSLTAGTGATGATSGNSAATSLTINSWATFSAPPAQIGNLTYDASYTTQPVAFTPGRIQAANAKFLGATSAATQVQIGPDFQAAGFFSPFPGTIQTNAALYLPTALLVESGGTGGNSQEEAYASLDINRYNRTYANMMQFSPDTDYTMDSFVEETLAFRDLNTTDGGNQLRDVLMDAAVQDSDDSDPLTAASGNSKLRRVTVVKTGNGGARLTGTGFRFNYGSSIDGVPDTVQVRQTPTSLGDMLLLGARGDYITIVADSGMDAQSNPNGQGWFVVNKGSTRKVSTWKAPNRVLVGDPIPGLDWSSWSFAKASDSNYMTETLFVDLGAMTTDPEGDGEYATLALPDSSTTEYDMWQDVEFNVVNSTIFTSEPVGLNSRDLRVTYKHPDSTVETRMTVLRGRPVLTNVTATLVASASMANSAGNALTLVIATEERTYAFWFAVGSSATPTVGLPTGGDYESMIFVRIQGTAWSFTNGAAASDFVSGTAAQVAARFRQVVEEVIQPAYTKVGNTTDKAEIYINGKVPNAKVVGVGGATFVVTRAGSSSRHVNAVRFVRIRRDIGSGNYRWGWMAMPYRGPGMDSTGL